MPVIYLDLDGTLLDVWLRYYTVMRLFFDRSRLPFPSLEAYKRQKWEWVDDEAIIRNALRDQRHDADEFVSRYRTWKREALESEPLLQLDRPIGELQSFAAQVAPPYRLQLISVRRNPDRAMQQLRQRKLIDPFERIELVPPSRGGNPKREALRDRASRYDVLIGDSEVDIGCGAMLGMRTFHVMTGLRSFAYAARHGDAVSLRRYDEVLPYL